MFCGAADKRYSLGVKFQMKWIIVTAVTALAVVAGIWAWRVHLSPNAQAKRAAAMGATAELRDAVLSRKMLLQAGVPDTAMAFVMDWQVASGQLATLVSFDDGTTSLYFSTGAGFIGAGELPTVKPQATRFREAFAGLDRSFQDIHSWPAPAKGKFVFYRIDNRATAATAQFEASELQSKAHPLHIVAKAAQDLISAIRMAEPPKSERRE